MQKVFKYLGVVLIVLGIVLTSILLITKYDDFENEILLFLSISFEKKERLSQFITLRDYQFFRLVPLGISLTGYLIYYLSGRISNLFIKIKNWINSSLQYLFGLPKIYLWIAFSIVVLSFILKTFLVLKMPVFYDEAFTYLSFSKRTILFSMSYYPAPNNHILHSILTNITYYLPFSQTVNLRLPNLIINTISGIFLFYTFTKLLNVKIATLMLSIYSFLFPVLYYGYLSRGYSLELFAFIICFYSVLQLIKSKNESSSFKKYLTLLSIGSIIGFYTIPSFLYPYFTITSFLFFYFVLRKEIQKLIAFTISGVITAFVVVLLYIPVFFISGIDSITHNKFDTPISRLEVLQKLPTHFSSTIDFLYSIPFVVGIIIILLISAYLFLCKYKVKFVALSIYCFLMAPIILLIHSVIPYPRTWVYLVIPFLFLIGMFIHQIKIEQKVKTGTWMLLSIIVILILIFNFKQRIFKQEKFSFAAKETSAFLIDQQAKKVYSDHPLVSTNLVYIFEEEKKNIEVIYSQNQDIIQDTLLLNNFYDFIITKVNIDSLNDFKLIKKIGDNIYISKMEKTSPEEKQTRR